VPDVPPPILDYAPPPNNAWQEWLETTRSNWLLSLVFNRPLTAMQVAVVWVIICGAHFTTEINDYFLKSPFDLTLVRVIVGIYAVPMACVLGLVILYELAIERFKTASKILVLSAVVACVSGIYRAYDSPFESRAMWWLDDVPGWKTL